VLDGEGAVIPEIRSAEDVADSLGESETTDVTGGMAHKVERMLSLEVPASVFGLEDLPTFLSDGTAGTIIR
jgi:isopentenyl phosphate kinase